jgi:hypothetical protein
MKNAFVPIAAALLLCSTLMAQGDDEVARASLKALSGVTVVVEDIRPDAEREGDPNGRGIALENGGD